jgi:putative acetyltransferase
MKIAIRPERPEDVAAVSMVERAAFDRTEEADLVDRLRASVRPHVSLVAEVAAEIVGHIFFSPVTIAAASSQLKPMGLAPMAVMPARQRAGIGGALIRAGLGACRELGAGAVVVLGHAEYYPRFGFVPAVRFGLRCEYPVPDEAFMALELVPGALRGVTGLVRYAPEFAGV